MPFDRGSFSCRVCHLDRPLPKDALERFAAKAAGGLDAVREEPQLGWVSGRHLLETRIDEETAITGGHLHLCLRQAVRKIPPALLRAECRLVELAAQKEAGTSSVNRKERKRIREEVTTRMLPQMPPQLGGTPFVVEAATSRLYLGATSDRQLDAFLGLFSDTLGFDPVPLTAEIAARDLFQVDPDSLPRLLFAPDRPQNAGAEQSPLGRDFLTWLWFLREETGGNLPKSAHGEFAFELDGPLVFAGDGPDAQELVIRKGAPTSSAEAQAALLAGKKLKRAKLTIARARTEVWSVTVDADKFIFRGLRLPDGEALEEHAAFAERIISLHLFQALFYALFERYLGEVRERRKAEALEHKLQDWVRGRNVTTS